MKDILQKWLQERLGLLIEMEKLGHYMKDGTMFVRILKHYDAVNSLSIDIQPSQDDVACKINLIQLKVWFRLLGVDFNNEIIEDVLSGKMSSCVNILYQLYLCLENKNSLHFVPKQKERLMRKHAKKFRVTEFSLSDLKQKKSSYKNEYYYKYSNRLLEHDDIIKWYENKHCKRKNPAAGKSSFLVPIDIKDLKKSARGAKLGLKKRSRFDEDVYYIRNELDRYNSVNKSGKCSFDAHFYSLIDEDFDGSHSKCMSQSKNMASNFKPGSGVHNRVHFLPPLISKEKQSISITHDIMLDVENYLKKLKCGIKLSFKSRRIAKTLSDFIINDVWEIILDNEEDDFRKIIAHRLLKQSLYERELAMKFFQIMNQSEVQKQSYAEIEKRIKSMRQKLDDDRESGCYHGSGMNEDEDKPLSYHDYVLYYQDERKRTVELHRRLYAEKLKLRFQKHYALCLETIEDIIDIVIKKSEFKSIYDMPVPERLWTQWKCLFHHGLPVYDVDEVSFDMKSDFESFELNRQTVLNECDLDDYLDIQREWDYLFEEDLSNLSLNNFSQNSENQFIVGYIVHRLLETKYPCQPPPKPANIPKYPFRVILNDVDDEEAIVKLRALLSKAEILVVDVNLAVNSCLQCYKDEIGYENYDLSCKKTSKASGSLKSSVVPNVTANVLQQGSKVIEEASKIKSTQTSLSSLSDTNEVLLFGEAAKLGGELFNMMLLGNELPTSSIVDIVIEYIKSNSHKIKGWVLVNFPSTLFQASVFEYALTSKKFPYHLEDDTASVFDSDVNPGKENKDTKDSTSYTCEVEVRSSRIVPNPRECDGEDIFKTYFSKFLTAIKGQVVAPNCYRRCPATEEFDSCHSESTLLLEHPEREGVPAINEFYREQGISYDFIYEKFDLNTIKQLARNILAINVEDNNRLSSSSLFGDDVLDELAESEDSKFYGASGFAKTECSPTKAVKNSALSTACEHAAGLLSSFDLEHHACSTSCNESSVHDEKRDVISKPGDKNWSYAHESLPDNVAIVLASFWENLETVYLNNLKEVFYLKRNTDYSLIPYINYVTKTIHLCLNQEDYRQSIVTEFLNQYNGIHQVLRSDEEMKTELHLRVNDLKKQLMRLCESKQNSVEEMRRTLINQNWTYLQMAAIANCFISMLQIEIDRCMRTLDLIKDYYYAMLGLFKSEPLIYNDVKLLKIELGIEEESEENVVALQIIERMLNCDNLVSTVNPVYNIIENKAGEVCSTIEKLKSTLDNIIAIEETNALKLQKDLFNKKYHELAEQEKRQGVSKGKARSTSKDDELMKQLCKDSEDLKEENSKKEAAGKNLFLEWSCGVKGEIDRTLFRIEMIKKKALVDLLEVENGMASTFSHFYDAIMLKFNAECNCIDRLCVLFQLAIEEKTPIHADIVLNQDQLYVTKRTIEKVETVVKLPPALEEMLFEESFTIKQLEEINERLKYVAPDGVISQEAFITLIQCMIVEGANHGSVKLVPKIWNKLNQDEFSFFFQKVFGNSGLIEWRDFLIYCLDLPYPVTADIIDAKLQFLRYDPQETETVSYDNYMSTTLWFHRELPETPLHALHNILAKEFLFSLYKIEDENLINYTLLLMAFCKDEDVKVGFGKGLSLLYGKAIIMFKEDLFLEKILSDHINTGFKIVNHILEEIIEDITETAFGIITDVNNLRYREQNLQDLDNMSNTAFETNGFGSLVTEFMYDQFFRRHLALQWTSKVPYVVIITLLSIAFYPVFTPYYVFDSYSRAFDEMRTHIAALQEIGEYFVYTPSFFNHSWLETMLKTLNKFRALSLTNIIKEIISARKSVINS